MSFSSELYFWKSSKKQACYAVEIFYQNIPSVRVPFPESVNIFYTNSIIVNYYYAPSNNTSPRATVKIWLALTAPMEYLCVSLLIEKTK